MYLLLVSFAKIRYNFITCNNLTRKLVAGCRKGCTLGWAQPFLRSYDLLKPLIQPARVTGGNVFVAYREVTVSGILELRVSLNGKR